MGEKKREADPDKRLIHIIRLLNEMVNDDRLDAKIRREYKAKAFNIVDGIFDWE
jgi:hypothetical protein